ncbi:class I SAM-dependent methyltransferase [Streptomyces sp. NPDC093228]|uniref:class I SAM-dependent methyltransferase n=1 Tax=unclassified Streptomyces TaxID=2593676 RepID=UPI0007412DA1|nr:MULTISPECIES: class I SAM-dependent methyltransferase [unclassified Streptomyces]KUJ51339.1 methyltransferase [Streptomyces sp. NRRL F-5122]MDX3261522.1 class I SAM-dependent methyltransferase [Streptomyces sp. MI02-2A]REE62807.1 RNA cap guanine-N2 methyltransferase [Streptomyces sp. 3212.3]
MNDLSFASLLTPEGRALLDEVRGTAPAQELAVATRLRREHPADLVSAALAQARLRQRAAAKFGAEDAEQMFFTANGVEQSTRTAVAAHRAGRLRELGATSVADLCCGIGGDAIAFARAGIRVLAVDRDPLTAAAARANAEALGLSALIEVREADVTDVDVSGYDAVFVDPARRGGRGRIFDPEAYSPPLSWAVATALKAPHAALKVAPGIPHEAVPTAAEAEWISDGGDVKEAVLWFGTQPGLVRATLLPGPRVLRGRALPDPPVRAPGRYLYEPDGAAIRAHLVAEVAEELDGGLIDETIAYVTADEHRDSPYATAYEITDRLPFNVKRLKALLREREVGVVTVKKRGSAVEPEELRRKVLPKPHGPNAVTVFLTRVAGAPTMLLGHPA